MENVSPARKTLLLGLRFMPSHKDLWREYIKLEIGWVEALRRRWKVLGIDLAGDEDAAGMEADIEAGLPRDDDDDEDAMDLGENAFGASGEHARKAIIRGDLIITVLHSAFTNAQLSKDLAFHLDLLRLFRRYPTGLRPRLLDAVYTHLTEEPAFRWNPVARRTLIERTLYDAPYDPDAESTKKPRTAPAEEEEPVVLQGQALVVELGKIVKALRGNDSAGAPPGWEEAWNEQVGMWLLHWAEKMADNEDLVRPAPRRASVSRTQLIPYPRPQQAYLFAATAPLVKPSARPTEPLLRRMIDYLESLETPAPGKLAAVRATLGSLYPESAGGR